MAGGSGVSIAVAGGLFAVGDALLAGAALVEGLPRLTVVLVVVALAAAGALPFAGTLFDDEQLKTVRVESSVSTMKVNVKRRAVQNLFGC
jgi:hypothetical protein